MKEGFEMFCFIAFPSLWSSVTLWPGKVNMIRGVSHSLCKSLLFPPRLWLLNCKTVMQMSCSYSAFPARHQFYPSPVQKKNSASHKWDTGILLKVLEATLNKTKQYKVQSSGAVQKSILISNTNYKAGLQDPLTFVTGCIFRVYGTTQYK